MAKYKGPRQPPFKKGSVQYLLEQTSPEAIKNAKQMTDKLLKHYWNVYSELARQRNAVKDELSAALTQTCISNYEFNYWQRIVKYEHGLHPLCTVGSLNWIGGRFNTGEGVNSEAPNFPALYLAQDKDTALQETLGQNSKSSNLSLNSLELALNNPSSITVVSVSGRLEKVFDLTKSKNLIPFMSLIKEFSLPNELKQQAKFLNVPETKILKFPHELLQTVLDPNWRFTPANMDVPANSQIFGHLIYSARIEGILYPSKLTKKPCLAIFPRNFSKTDSFICLDDKAPTDSVPSKIDAKNWRDCELTYQEIMSNYSRASN